MAFRFPSVPAACRNVWVAAAVATTLWLVPVVAAAGEPPGTFVRQTFHDEEGEHGYVVFVPKDYAPDRAWPVMLFLHGAGERGTDGVRPSEVGLGAMIRRWDSFPWIVVFPQAEDTRGPIKRVWAPEGPDGRRALAILDEVERTYRVDPERRVLTGWSMGGRGTYMLAAAFPEKWSAVVPVAGWADLDLAPALTKVPLWAFHGTADTLVSYDEDRALIEKIRAAGGKAWLTSLPEEGHYVWRTVYASPAVLEWMREPDGDAGREEPPTLDPRPDVELPLSETAGPFVPGLELDNAVAIRIGPDLFRDLSEIVEDQLSRQPIAGTMAGTATESKQGCIAFDVRTSKIRYRVPISDVQVSPTDRGTLRLLMKVSRAELAVGRTEVSGGLRCEATAGPMRVVFGHRAPVAVEVEAIPYVQGNEFRLRTTGVRFGIPSGNWYVTRPAVDSRSLFLPAGKVADSLVEGVYASKGRIERDFRRSVADAIDEQKLELPPVTDDQLLTALWPIPAYRPRLRPWLRDVTVDGDGLVVTFGLTAAAVDPFRPPGEAERIDFGLTAASIGRGDLAVAAAENLVGPLTGQLIDAGVAHVNVVDIPGDRYSRLADRETLSRAIPAVRDLPETAEVRTELYLRKPLDLGGTDEIEQVCSPDGCYSVFDMRIPELAAVISVREARERPWRDFAEFSYEVTQPIRVEVGAELERGREVVTACAGSATVRTSGRWLGPPPVDDRLDEMEAARLFREGWDDSSQACGPTAFLIPDLEFRGYVRRLERLEPGTRGLSAIFEEPETVLTNAADVPLVFRTRVGNGPWGESETLSPGERRAFRASRTLGYEGGAGGRPERYDLRPGRDATFRRIEGGGYGLTLDPLPPALKPRESLPGTAG